MDAPTTPLKWSTKKSNNSASAAAPGSSSYHLKSPPVRTPGGGGGGGSQHSNNGAARSIRSNANGNNGRMTAVFCDVVVEGVERNAEGWDLPPGEDAWLNSLHSWTKLSLFRFIRDLDILTYTWINSRQACKLSCFSYDTLSSRLG